MIATSYLNYTEVMKLILGQTETLITNKSARFAMLDSLLEGVVFFVPKDGTWAVLSNKTFKMLLN
jgi:hypothetical protein